MLRSVDPVVTTATTPMRRVAIASCTGTTIPGLPAPLFEGNHPGHRTPRLVDLRPHGRSRHRGRPPQRLARSDRPAHRQRRGRRHRREAPRPVRHGRLRGSAPADGRRPRTARCVEEYGAAGLRILPWLWDLPPDDRRYYPLYAACCDLDITFCTQIGHTGPLAPSEPGYPIHYLDHVAPEFSELRIVAGHIGVPWTNEAISLATKYPDVYIDTSAYKRPQV